MSTISNTKEPNGSQGGEYTTLIERLTCMEQSVANMADRVSDDIKEIKGAVKDILAKLTELDKQITQTDNKLERDFVKKTEMPCESHKGELQSQDKKLQQLHEDLVVIKTKWTSEFNPMKSVAYALMMIILTAIVTAGLSLIMIKAQVPTFYQQQAPHQVYTPAAPNNPGSAKP